jgi:predicted nucleic acid-binding Zn ribbon protein
MNPKNKPELTHVGTFISNILNTCRSNRPDIEMTKIWSLWQEAIGPTIAENARPAAFKGKVLLVNVTSSPWMQQLQFLKQDIIRKLNSALGKEMITEIKFKIGSL